MEELLDKVLKKHKSVIRGLEVNNQSLIDEVSALKNTISELTNASCTICGAKRDLGIKRESPQIVTVNHEPNETDRQCVENLVFDGETETQVDKVSRRPKRRKNVESSSQEQKRRKTYEAEESNNTVEIGQSKHHKLLKKLETEATQFPESLNPALVLVHQTCDVENNVNKPCSDDENVNGRCGQISVIPETVPMDLYQEENPDKDFDERNRFEKSIEFLDVSDSHEHENSMRNVPDTVRKMFIGSPSQAQSPEIIKLPKLKFNVDEKCTEINDMKMRSPMPRSNVDACSRSSNMTPKGQKAKNGNISAQIGYTQIMNLLDDDSQEKAKKGNESECCKNQKNADNNVLVDGKSVKDLKKPYSSIDDYSDGSQSPVFDAKPANVFESYDGKDMNGQFTLPNLASQTISKSSPLVSQGFKIGSNPTSSGSSDSPIILKITYNTSKVNEDTKSDKLFQIEMQDKCRMGTGNLNDHEETGSDGVHENRHQKHKESVSQESGTSGSQSLVSSRMSLSRNSGRRRIAELSKTGEKGMNRSLAQSKSDSHLMPKKKPKSKSAEVDSPGHHKSSSLPNSPLSQVQNITAVAASSDDELRSDAGFKSSAEEVWLSAKKPEPKKHKGKVVESVTLKTSAASSPKILDKKSFRQQTLISTLRKNTEMDLCETVTFNGGVLSSKKPDADDLPNISFELGDNDDDDSENVPPSPQKPKSQRSRCAKKSMFGTKVEKKRVSLDMTFDPDATCLPQGDSGSVINVIDASPCFRKDVRSPNDVVQGYDHDANTSYSLLPDVQSNSASTGERFSARKKMMVPTDNASEMSESILNNSNKSEIFLKKVKLRSEGICPKYTGTNSESLGDGLLCTETNLSEDVPFYSTCRSAVFGKGGNVSVGLPPNFSELASEIPQNSELPGVSNDKILSRGIWTKKRVKNNEIHRDLLDSDSTLSLSQTSKLRGRKGKTNNGADLLEKSAMLLIPDYESQLDFVETDMETSLRFSGRSKQGVKGQGNTRSSTKTSAHPHSDHRNFISKEMGLVDDEKNDDLELDDPSNLDIFQRNYEQCTDDSESEGTGNKGRKFVLATQRSYVFDGKDKAGKSTFTVEDVDQDDDALMADLCKSRKFGPRPKTFANDSQDVLNDFITDEDDLGSIIQVRTTDVVMENDLGNDFGGDLEEGSQGLGDEVDYPCPGFVATPVDESTSDEKHISRRRRRQRSEVNETMETSFDRVPKNDDPGYAYYKVERNRQKRTHCMHGHDCAGCKEYYDYLPEEERQKRMQESSRHRAYYIPPSTPPHFWSLKIPSTQTLAKMRGNLDESYTAEHASVKSPKRQPNKTKEKFRRKNRLRILPPKFEDKD